MKHWFIYMALLSIAFSYLSSLRVFRLDLPKQIKYFSFFLLFVLMGETFAYLWYMWIYKFTPFSAKNHWFYNSFHFFSYLFYFYFFYETIILPKIKKFILGLTILYFIWALVNVIFIQGFFSYNSFSDVLGNFIMIFLSISYYYQLLYAKEVVALRNDTVFWISTGAFVYHLGAAMGLLLIDVMNVISIERARSILKIIGFAAMLMYITYTIGFLCKKKI